MKINKKQQICDIDNCYKSILFITEEFVSNKVLWTCEKHKDLLDFLHNLIILKFL